MGGRGASSGISDSGKRYGTEYATVYEHGNIKYIRLNEANNAKIPLETMTKGRVYAVINDSGDINSIDYYDNKTGKHKKSINLLHEHSAVGVKLPKGHTHEGYYHSELGSRHMTAQERKLVEKVKRAWYNRKR